MRAGTDFKTRVKVGGQGIKDRGPPLTGDCHCDPLSGSLPLRQARNRGCQDKQQEHDISVMEASI